jgi:hypothetical protein
VLLGAILPVAALLPFLQRRNAGPACMASWLRESIPGSSAIALGERYLRTYPAERSAGRLSRELFGCSLSHRVDRPGFERLMRRVQVSRARDFLRGDLVLLEGWAMPRTEARLLALLAFGEAR